MNSFLLVLGNNIEGKLLIYDSVEVQTTGKEENEEKIDQRRRRTAMNEERLTVTEEMCNIKIKLIQKEERVFVLKCTVKGSGLVLCWNTEEMESNHMVPYDKVRQERGYDMSQYKTARSFKLLQYDPIS